MVDKIFIYRIYFPVNGKCYISQTSNLKRRMLGHVNGRVGRISLVHNALIKYDGWKVSVLHTCKSRDEANRVEIEEIRNFDSVEPNGYNLTHGGGSEAPSEITKARMRQAALGREISKDQREKLRQANLGKRHPEEVKQKIKEASAGDKNSFYEKKHTIETKVKMSRSNRIGQRIRRLKEYRQKIQELESGEL